VSTTEEHDPAGDAAQPERSSIRIERPEPGLAVLVLDPPHRPSLAVLDLIVMKDLEAALEVVAKDGQLKGLVVTGRGPLSFAAGADVEAIGSITEPERARELVRMGQAIFSRLEGLAQSQGGPLRTVAAVGGPVPGGAFELALSCETIVVADSDKTRIGLPEVKLGILPGWGGTHRLPRRIGVPAATSAILTGRLFRARAAKKLGMVDRLTQPEYLLRIASDLALGREKSRRRPRGWRSFAIDKNPLVAAVIESSARKKIMKETGGHYPAALKALELVVRAPRVSLRDGFEKEAQAIGELATGEVCKSLVGLFRLSEQAKKLGQLPDGSSAPRIARAAVIGGGVMGAGIASVMAEKGVETRLRDLDPAALDNAQRAHHADIGKKRKRRRLAPHLADAALDRLEVTTEPLGFGRCEIVVEAVAETLPIKRAVFGELAGLMADDAILATNTSSLSVTEIADGLPHPERVVGMHFFNPVPKMPLVEVVRGEATSDEVVARTAALALRLGKTPVVVKDVAGFLVNRVLGPYLDEALRMLEEGADPVHVDRLLRAFGMPMGPFELLDEVGLDIASHAADSLEAAYGERMKKSEALAPLLDAGMFGKKTGRGIYTWAAGKRGRLERGELNPLVARPHAPASISDAEIVDRAVLSMVNEGARCLEEGVVRSPGEADLATVFGTGFAPFRGGLVRYADTRGLEDVSRRLQYFASSTPIAGRPGGTAKFTPAPLLARLADEKGRFHES